MKNEDVLNLVRRCRLKSGKVLIPNKAYLFKRRFLTKIGFKFYNNEEEIIVLVENGKKVGGIYRMGTYDVHCVLKEKYRDQHIISNFLKTGIIQKIWPENKSVELCDVYTREEYEKKKHLADLLGMVVRNADKIEKFLSYVDEQRFKHNYNSEV